MRPVHNTSSNFLVAPASKNIRTNKSKYSLDNMLSCVDNTEYKNLIYRRKISLDRSFSLENVVAAPKIQQEIDKQIWMNLPCSFSGKVVPFRFTTSYKVSSFQWKYISSLLCSRNLKIYKIEYILRWLCLRFIA